MVSAHSPVSWIPQSDAGLRKICESIPHMVWIADSDGSVEYVNRLATEYTGEPAAALEGRGWLTHVHPDDVATARAGWDLAIRTQTPYRDEYRVRDATGGFRWHAVEGVPVRGGEARARKWIGTVRDVHHERAIERELRKVERDSAEMLTLLDTLQSMAPVGFAYVDRDFRIARINDRLAALNGSSVERQIGRTIAEVVPERWPDLEPMYRHVLETGESVVNREMSGTSAESPEVLCHWLRSYYPVRMNGEVIGIAVVVVDVTERKLAESSRIELTQAAVTAIGATVEVRDPYTAGHQDRVAQMSAAIAREMGLDRFSVKGVKVAASIHDIGKLAIPSEILNKPGPLRPAEFELIKNHSKIGHDIVAGITFPWPVAEMILRHHERLDGSGYPDGLTDEGIVIGARVIAVADVFEAMSSHRPYRASRGVGYALDELRRGSGARFDATVVDAFMRLIEDGRISDDQPSASEVPA